MIDFSIIVTGATEQQEQFMQVGCFLSIDYWFDYISGHEQPHYPVPAIYNGPADPNRYQ